MSSSKIDIQYRLFYFHFTTTYEYTMYNVNILTGGHTFEVYRVRKSFCIKLNVVLLAVFSICIAYYFKHNKLNPSVC